MPITAMDAIVVMAFYWDLHGRVPLVLVGWRGTWLLGEEGRRRKGGGLALALGGVETVNV